MRGGLRKIPQFKSARVVVCSLVMLCTTTGALAGIQGITLGFVFDRQAHGIRPIVGIPGASVQGEALRLGVSLADAVISTRQDYALAVAGDRTGLIQIMDLSGSISTRLLAAGPHPIDLLRLSASGTAAAFYHADARTVQLISGLPRRPWTGDELDLSALPGPVASIAVSDDARWILAAVNTEYSGQVFLMDAHGSTRKIFESAHISALAFTPGRHDAVVADDSSDTVHFIRSVDSNAASWVIAARTDGIAGPAAISTSEDGRRVFVVNTGSSSVLAVDLASGGSAKYKCPCAPTDLTALGGRAVFVLSHTADAPIWIFDGDAVTPRIVFVPRVPASQHSNQGSSQ
jgi:hypothetical protein